MTALKINEQIAFLRKQKGLTQEELAQALGVTNQSVSKWESAQCCPDIQLLPELASIFEVTVDELLGYTPPTTDSDLLLALRKRTEALPGVEDAAFTYQTAAALHAILFSKRLTAEPSANPGWDTEEAVAHGARAEWGYSCINLPEISTVMQQGVVFFSNNKALHLTNPEIRRISNAMKAFSDAETLRIAAALYELTVFSEDAAVAPEEVAAKAGGTTEAVTSCLMGPLADFVLSMEGKFRFLGRHQHLIPLLSLFDVKL